MDSPQYPVSFIHLPSLKTVNYPISCPQYVRHEAHCGVGKKATMSAHTDIHSQYRFCDRDPYLVTCSGGSVATTSFRALFQRSKYSRPVVVRVNFLTFKCKASQHTSRIQYSREGNVEMYGIW